MKKTLALSFILLAALSCSKELAETTPANEEHPLVPMTFTADIEGTKAFFEGVKSYWEKGDQISVCKGIVSTGYDDAPVMTATKDGASTTFTGTAPAGLTKYLAAYPAAKITKWKRDSGTTKDTAYGTIKATQIVQKISTTGGVDNYIDPEVMYLCGTATPSATDTNFTFKHPLAYIKFTVPEGMTKGIKTVSLSTGPVSSTGLTEGKSISGGFTMQWINTYWNMGLQGLGKKITLKNYTDTATNLKPGNYYIVIFPRASATASSNYAYVSFDFYHYSTAAGNIHIYKQITGGTVDFKIAGGTVYDIGTLPVDLFDE